MMMMSDSDSLFDTSWTETGNVAIQTGHVRVDLCCSWCVNDSPHLLFLTVRLHHLWLSAVCCLCPLSFSWTALRAGGSQSGLGNNT